MPARLRALKRTLFASAAVFAALLTFLSLQMLLGRDPAVRGEKPAQTAQKAPEAQGAGHSVLGSILGIAAKVVSDGEGGDDGGSGSGPSLNTHTS